MLLDGPEELELALRLLRDDSLMAKRESRRKRYFVAPSARRKIKSIAASPQAVGHRSGLGPATQAVHSRSAPF